MEKIGNEYVGRWNFDIKKVGNEYFGRWNFDMEMLAINTLEDGI